MNQNTRTLEKLLDCCFVSMESQSDANLVPESLQGAGRGETLGTRLFRCSFIKPQTVTAVISFCACGFFLLVWSPIIFAQ